MKDAFLTIHGHFYQPPRENPWLEAIETETSAYPFHDWNERITFECYRPNAYARIIDDQGKISALFNNYSFLSFNFGPTILSYLEKKFPRVYQKIIEADRESKRRLGHGNAIAQAYNHIIMPLANDRDKETEVLWGIADFEKRFHRRPEAMWLPETAVNYSTLQVLAKYGMKFLILSPFQALRIRPLGGRKWTDVSQGRIDPTQPYRCFIKDPSGKRLPDQSMDIFFYEGTISKEVAFGDLLRDGKVFCERFSQRYQPFKKRPQLLHIATDGETYGHHKKFGEMALAYFFTKEISLRGFEIINYGAFLNRFPPIYEVEIDEGPKGEGTSWSCPHGVARWKEDCGCSTGGKPGWNQQWRKPLREALDLLRDEMGDIFEEEGKEIFQNVWEARNDYINVILDRSSDSLNRFFERYGVEGLDESKRIKGLKLLEMERHSLLMYTSCGWFFADLAGLETVQILLYASRAIQLAEELTGQEIEKRFVQNLSQAKSNLPEMGDGGQIYLRLVKPRAITFDRLVNHYATFTLFDQGEGERRFYSYRMKRINYKRMEQDDRLLVLGEVKVTSEITQESKDFLFGLSSSGKDLFQTWVGEQRGEIGFESLVKRGTEGFKKGEEETENVLGTLFGYRPFTIQDIFKEEAPILFQKLLWKELNEYRQIYTELFEKTKKTMAVMAKEGFDIPYEMQVAAEVTFNHWLFQETENLKRDLKNTIQRGEIDKIIDEARNYGVQLKMEKFTQTLSLLMKEKLEILYESILHEYESMGRNAEKIEELIRFLDWTKKLGFQLQIEEVQDVMGEIFNEYKDIFEKSWWGEAIERPFPPNIILLAEKLNFNVDQFLPILPRVH